MQIESKSDKTQQNDISKKITPVVQNASLRPKSSKLKDSIKRDAMSVGDYILKDVIFPALKNGLWEIVTNGLAYGLWKEEGMKRMSKTRRPADRYPSYNSIYDRLHSKRNSSEIILRNSRGVFDYDDVLFPTRGDAELCLCELNNIIDDYKLLTVREFYECAGINVVNSNTLEKYGWTNIDGARVCNVSDGWIISMPKASPID